jgi:hypothetical protein
MIDSESPQPSNPESCAERLLAMAESSPEVRARLVQRWASEDTWTLVEGIALAWTLDPSTLGRSDVSRASPETALPEEAKPYVALARRSPALSGQPVTPLRFIDWAHSAGLAFHPDWRHAADQAASERMRTRALEADQKRERLIAHWVRAAYWEPEEGVALAFDLDPKETAGRLVGAYDRRLPPDANHLWELARRAIDVGALDDRATPIAFMTWARATGVEFHADWWDVVVTDEREVDDAQAGPSTPAAPFPDLKTKEQETLLKMVAGMAMAYYGWDRDALRSNATAEIASDLAKAGITLDTDTIRKWLKKSAELIPSQDG